MELEDLFNVLVILLLFALFALGVICGMSFEYS